MTDTSVRPSESPSLPARFVEQLGKLDRGERAILRRSAGRTLAESRHAMSLFFRIALPGIVGHPHEEVYFLVATLYALNSHSHAGDFGTTMREVASARMRRAGRPAGERDSGIDRRMAALLDSEFDRIDGRCPGGGEMAYRLRQCVVLAASVEVGVDWICVIEDLLQWSHPSKRVRKKWARSYFGSPATDGDERLKEANADADRDSHASEPRAFESQPG